VAALLAPDILRWIEDLVEECYSTGVSLRDHELLDELRFRFELSITADTLRYIVATMSTLKILARRLIAFPFDQQGRAPGGAAPLFIRPSWYSRIASPGLAAELV
jgi:hypothetical protein